MFEYREIHPFINEQWVIILNPDNLERKFRSSLVEYCSKKMWPQGSSSYPIAVYTLILTTGKVIQLQCTGTIELKHEMETVERILAPLTLRPKDS